MLTIDEGRKLLRQQAWSAAFSCLSAADREAPLEAEDLEGLANAAQLMGMDAESTGLLARAHQGFLAQGDARRAARCALWLGFSLLINGEHAKSGGWLARAARLLEGESDCVEKGYLLLPDGYRSVHEGDAVSAHRAFVAAGAIAERFNDKDLMTLALQGQGRALIRQGEIQRGVTLLDEAMVAVTSGEVSSTIAGRVYCSVIEACGEIYDLGRAHEWTSALEEWCKSRPDVVPYRGHCLVRRAEILQLRGAWIDALDQAERALEILSRSAPKPEAGAATYRMAELHRLRGDFAKAEDAYRQASRWNRTPQPGLALLRLAQGQLESANAAIRRVADEVREGAARARILDAYVEIVLAANDVAEARGAAHELEEIAGKQPASFLTALSCRANGAVLLSESKPREAIGPLRQAWTIWCELEAPYEAARTQVLFGRAYRKIGDDDAATLELSAARDVFQRLAAATDLAGVEALLDPKAHTPAGPLTVREVQIIQLIAAGMTNKGIAKKLGISEKTVARHVSNIFTKLDLSSRAAATAYAYRHKLV